MEMASPVPTDIESLETQEWFDSLDYVLQQGPERTARCCAARTVLEEAASENRAPTNRNRIEGYAEQGERASSRKALAIKAQAE